MDGTGPERGERDLIGLGDVDQFILDLDRARTQSEIRGIVLRAMTSLGFPYFAYVAYILPDGRQEGFYLGNYPEAWSVRFRAERYFCEDPVMPYRVRSLLPYSWGDVRERLTLTGRQQQIFGEAGEFGLRSGAAVPLQGPGALRAVFSVAGGEQDEVFARNFMHHRHRIQLMANYMHDRLIPFMPEAALIAPQKITERESEILVWTARGKTSWEISTILMISDETVRHHLKSICRKLGVNNKTHAASLCIARGMLRL